MKKKTVVIITIAILAIITTVTGIFIYPPLKATKEAVQYISEKYKISENDLTVEDYQARSVHASFLHADVLEPETCIVNTTEGKRIIVVREEDHWADNNQLLDISYLAADYFSTVFDCDVDFVEFNYTSSGNRRSRSLETYLKSNNTLWNESNITLFIKDYTNQKDNLMNLYIKEINMSPDYLSAQSRKLAKALPIGSFNLIYHDVSLEIVNVQQKDSRPKLYDFECYLVENNPLQPFETTSDHFVRYPVNFDD